MARSLVVKAARESVHRGRNKASRTLKAEAGERGGTDICVVTGASRGIGRAIALELGSRGNKVVVNYSTSKGSAEEVCNEISNSGGSAIPVQANCTNKEEVDHLFKQCSEDFGTPSVLVNNAGITRDTLMMRMKEDQWDDVINTNLSGVFRCCQTATRLMGKERYGRIVNIASVVGLIGNAGQVNYSAAKAGVLGVTKSVAREYAGRNITCNAVAPGFITSDMTEQLSEEVSERILESIPLKRYGEADEVAGVVRFLATDPAAAYITGETVTIDGGLVMK
jgi:3-oxoacyl-[acyl-carrier protein] reductase